MAKSIIIKELANGEIDLGIALKRTKVLLYDLENEGLINWINYEMSGYPDDEELPDYRKAFGTLKGSYYKGSIASHTTWNNVTIPFGKMPDDIKETITCIKFREGVDALKQLLITAEKNESKVGAEISADMFPYIANWNDDPYMIFTSIRIEAGAQSIKNILSAIENRLLDILISLEKEFGVLDDLDIDVSSKSSEELEKIIDNIGVTIYNDNRINIGDGNNIKGSTLTNHMK